MLSTTFDPVYSDIDIKDALSFENGLSGTTEKSDIEAYVRLRTIYSKNSWTNDTLTE